MADAGNIVPPQGLVIGRGRVRNRPQRPRVLPPQQEQWKIEALRLLGWQSRTAGQTTTYNSLKESADRVLDGAMRGGGEHGAAATTNLLKGAGEEFQAYHRLRTAFEKAKPRTPDMVEGLRRAAQAYLDHYAEHDRWRRQDTTNVKKKEACDATIKELAKFDLAQRVDQLGAPPWDSVASMEGASLKTSFDLLSMPKGEQRPQTLDGEHNSPAFWIKGRNDRGETDRSYILKPMCKSAQPGFPDGGEPGREALSARMADMLNGALGLTLPVPETQIVSLPKTELPEESYKPKEDAFDDQSAMTDGKTVVGSVQQFERTQGEMRDLSRGALAQIPTRATQELAVLDIVLLNTDRHGGNMLVKPGQNGESSLVPIDHGLCLPPREATDQLTNNIGTSHNALLGLPGSHEPFTPEMLTALDRLDPDVLAGGMKRERETIEQAHPATAGTVSDDAIELSRRSAMFLKLAARRLCPAAIQVGLSRFHAELFDPALDMQTFPQLVDRIVTELEGDQDDIKEFFLMPVEMQRKVKQDLAESGWQTGRFSAEASILANPASALRTWKAKLRAPNLERDPNRRPPDLDENTEQKVQEIIRAFPKTPVPKDDNETSTLLEDWRDWTRLGGTRDKLREAIGLIGVRPPKSQAAYEKLADAVKILKQGTAMKQGLANDTTDPVVAAIESELDFMTQLQPTLAPNSRQRAIQTIQRVRDTLNTQPPPDAPAKKRLATAVTRGRDELYDEGRARMKTKLEAIKNGNYPEDAKKRATSIKGELSGGAVVYAYQEIRQIDQALADAA